MAEVYAFKIPMSDDERTAIIKTPCGVIAIVPACPVIEMMTKKIGEFNGIELRVWKEEHDV